MFIKPQLGRLFLALILALVHFQARAATWYLQADQTTSWNTLSIWWSQPISGGTNPTSISAGDDFDLSGHQVYTPNSTGVNTFGGAHLIFHGGLGAFLDGKTSESNSLVIPNLTSYGGFIQNSSGTGTLAFTITNFVNNSNTTLDGCNNTRALSFTINTLSGGGDICAVGNGAGSAGGGVILNVTTATAFTGTLYINNGCQFTFANAMTSGGALDVGGAGTTVTLNSTVTFAGLTVNGTAMATGTYTAAALGFNGTGSIIVQASSPQTPPVTTAIGTNLPGGSFSTPFYPTDALVWNYLQTKNLNLVRVAFKWEQVQPTLNGPLSSSALASLDAAVALAAARGMQVFLDMHNYDRYNISGTSYIVGSTQVPYSAYQNAWQQIAAHFEGEQGIYGYDIMNEPNGDNSTWFTAAQYGVNGVRQSDSIHYVIVEGDSYAGAQSWMNVNAQLSVTDPAAKTIYSAHTYWDSNDMGTYSGSYDSNNDYPNVGLDRVSQFIYWLQLTGNKGLVGEFGVPNNVPNPDYRWNVALNNFLNDLNTNGVIGTYWSMTQNGWPDTYTQLCATGGKPPGPVKDAPAMSVLQTYALAGIVPTILTTPLAQTVTASQAATFSVAASGVGTLSYQWLFNGIAIAGATSSSYTIPLTSSASSGAYSVVITSPYGIVTTTPVTLTVTAATGIATDTPVMPPWMLVVLAGLLALFAQRKGLVPRRGSSA